MQNHKSCSKTTPIATNTEPNSINIHSTLNHKRCRKTRNGSEPLNRSLEVRLTRTWPALAPIGRFWVPFWTPLDFEGSIGSGFLTVFGAVATTRKYLYCCWKIRKCKHSSRNEQHKKRRSNSFGVSQWLSVPHVSFKTQEGEHQTKNLIAFWHHLGDLRRHCSVWATADTFGRWQSGATT